MDAAAPATRIDATRRRLFLVFVALLPLHTVFVRAWVAWKPWLVLLLILGVLQAAEGVRRRSWPWHLRMSPALAVFLAAIAVSWPGQHMDRFAALWLATATGGAVMLVAQRELSRRPEMVDTALRVVYWSAAAMGLSAVLLSLAAVGAFGAGAIDAVERLPGVLRVAKGAYLDEGFVALTNWHSDPGYAAAWMNLWAVLAFVAAHRGLGSGRRWLDTAVVGSLAFGVLMTLSRTGTLGLMVGLALAAWLAVREGAPWRSVALFLGGASLWTIALLGATLLADQPGVGGDLEMSTSFRLDQGVTLGSGVPGANATDPDSRAVVWPMYIDFFRHNPIRGIGLGVGWATEGVQEPHNLVLQLVGETGLVGLAGFVVLIVALFRSGVSRVGWIALATALSASLTQTVIFEPTWWFAAALALSPDPPAGGA